MTIKKKWAGDEVWYVCDQCGLESSHSEVCSNGCDGVFTEVEIDADPLEEVEQPVDITVLDPRAFPWERYGDWAPKDGDEYYYIHSAGGIKKAQVTVRDNTFAGRLAIGNVFKTAEDADLALVQIKKLLKR